MTILLILIGLLILGDRVWRQIAVLRFMGRERRGAPVAHELVTILQPILSGDPTLRASLEHNLVMRTAYAREYIWLVDEGDLEAQEVCQDLIMTHPECDIRQVAVPPPGDQQNPKVAKLIAGASLTRGQIVVVLDDDTRLPDFGLEDCLPALDKPGVGIAFGLPYYVNFENVWSSLLAHFVNIHSLLMYVPYLALSPPFTINGMFYAMRRSTLAEIADFSGLERSLADDFAVAQRIRDQGYRLAQTPVRHAISTFVPTYEAYWRIMQRWLIFPRESLMRQLPWREQCVLYAAVLLPALMPLALALAAIAIPSMDVRSYVLLYFAVSYVGLAQLNARFLHHASPWRRAWMVPLVQLLLPVQLLASALVPQQIVWRGHVMRAERGGGLTFLRHREQADEARTPVTRPGQSGAQG